MPQYYQLHGVRVAARCADDTVARVIRRTLSYKGAAPVDAHSVIDVRLDFAHDESVALPDDATLLGISEKANISVWSKNNHMYLSFGSAVVHLQPRAGVANAALYGKIIRAHEHQQRSSLFYLVTLSLIILLRYRKWYPLHTAALVRNEVGLLLVAQSDSGKSTVTLNLVRQNWDYLSDDTVLLRDTEAGIQAYSFRRNFCVDPEAVEYFPELAGQDWPSSLSDRMKWQVSVDDIYPGQFRSLCDPRVILLPKIVDEPRSRVAPADTKTALTALMKQSAFFLTPDRKVARHHLNVLRRLLDQSELYHLYAGRDARDDPNAVDILLRPLLKEWEKPRE